MWILYDCFSRLCQALVFFFFTGDLSYTECLCEQCEIIVHDQPGSTLILYLLCVCVCFSVCECVYVVPGPLCVNCPRVIVCVCVCVLSKEHCVCVCVSTLMCVALGSSPVCEVSFSPVYISYVSWPNKWLVNPSVKSDAAWRGTWSPLEGDIAFWYMAYKRQSQNVWQTHGRFNVTHIFVENVSKAKND